MSEVRIGYDDLFDEPASAWRNRLIVVAVIASLVAAGAYMLWSMVLRDGESTALPEQTATVTLGAITKSVSTSGTVAAQSTSNLNFETSGRVTKVFATLGQQVKQGDVLAEIDATSPQSALTSAKLSLASAQSKLEQVLGGSTASALASADQGVQQAQGNYDKAVRAMQTLQDPPDATTLASTQQAVTTALAQLQQAKDARAKIDTDNDDAVSAAESAVDKAQNALDSAEQAQSNAAAGVSSAQATLYNAETAYCPDPAVAFCSAHAAPISSSDRATLVDVTNTGTPTQAALASDVLSANTAYTKAVSDKQAADGSVDSAETALSDAEDALDKAEEGPTAGQIAVADAAIGSAQVQVDTAQDKLAKLLAGPTADDLAAAQSDIDSAAAGLTSAQAKRDETYAGPLATEIQQQRQSVSQAQSSVDRAQKDLDNTKLTAPFDGTVASLNIQVGDLAGTGTGGSSSTAAVVLNTPNTVILNLTVSETDYASVKAGQVGVATFDAITGQTFPIVIDAIGANPTTTQGVVTYSARARFIDRGAAFAGNPAASGAAPGGGQGFAFSGTPLAGRQGGGRAAAQTASAGAAATPQSGATQQSSAPAQSAVPAATATPAAKPVPGMNAKITIVTDQRQNVLSVPNGALQREGQDRVLQVKQSDGTTTKVTVQVGLSDSTNTEIVSGVEEGATIVIPGVTATNSSAAPTVAAGGFPGGGFRSNFSGGGAAPPAAPRGD